MDNSKKFGQNQNQIPINLKWEICYKDFKNIHGLKNHFNTIHDLEKICQKVCNN